MNSRLKHAMAASLMVLALAGCGKSDSPAGAAQEPAMVPAADKLMEDARASFKPIPLAPPKLEGINATAEVVALGRMLFVEPRLSASHALACASCHSISLGGADNRSTSVGHHWQLGGRNSPTVFNAAYNFSQFWDGRAKDLVEQAGGPMVNPVEMASPQDHVVEQLNSIPGYKALFAKAFPGEQDPVTLANVQKAIAAFESTLVTPGAPFDAYLRGDDGALDQAQKDGLKLFLEKGCASCHGGLNVGGGMYARFGMASDPDPKLRPAGDLGRFSVTKDEADKYSYKVPTLRNIALTAPYFHTGAVWDLGEAVRVMGKVQLGQDLSEDETTRIVAFLQSLTAPQPAVSIPALPPSGPNTTRPVD